MKTAVSIVDDAFYINGEITYPRRFYQDHKIEGLLINTRMVQGIFDDRNPRLYIFGNIRIQEHGTPNAIPANF